MLSKSLQCWIIAARKIKFIGGRGELGRVRQCLTFGRFFLCWPLKAVIDTFCFLDVDIERFNDILLDTTRKLCLEKGFFDKTETVDESLGNNFEVKA